jgi:hypothetical protein
LTQNKTCLKSRALSVFSRDAPPTRGRVLAASAGAIVKGRMADSWRIDAHVYQRALMQASKTD